MNSNPVLWDPDTLVRSNGFYAWLTKDSTYYFLMVYNEILIKTDTLFNVLQTKMIDIPYCIERINGTINLLEDLHKNFEELYVKFEENCREKNLSESKSRTTGSVKEERMRIFGVILDDILKNMKARFADFKNLKFISLVHGNKSQNLACQVDSDAFESLEKNYGNFFDIIRLKVDLAGIYNAQVLQDKSVTNLLDFIFENELTQTFPEAVKLQLILTIPATTVSVERSFSALKRIKSYTRNRMTNQRLSSLALISIEKERLIKMEQDPTFNFYEKVTDFFATKKERRMDFLYK